MPELEFTRDEFVVSTDPARLDFGYVARKLDETYWAKGRSPEVVRRSLLNSLCFGLYRGREQLGLVRVVTDRETFSWICDVFVDEAVRGRGLGVWLMECTLSHPDVHRTRCCLATRDAHGLYEKTGFARREMMWRPAP